MSSMFPMGYLMVPDSALSAPPRFGLTSPDMSASRLEIVISFSLDSKSICMPVPDFSCLKANPSSVALTVNTVFS